MNTSLCNQVWAVMIGPSDRTGPQVLESLWSTADKAWDYIEDEYPLHIEQGLITVEWRRIED